MFRHRYILHSHSPQMSVRLALGLSLAALAASLVLASPLVLVSSLQTRHSLVSSAVTSYCIEVGKGGSVIIACEVGDRRGRVQWTKDGLTLGK